MRGRGRVVLAALGAVAVYLLVAGVPGRGTADVTAVVDGYPQRVGFRRPAPMLPARPGALAATMRDNNFGDGRTVGITAHGEMYDLPPGPDVLSPDGRLLLTTDGDPSRPTLVLHDLVSGEVRPLDVVGPARRDPGRSVPHRLDSSQYAHLSPDGRSVLGAFNGRGYGGHAQLLDVTSLRLRDLGPASPAGFLSGGEAVTVRWAAAKPGESLEVTVTDPASGSPTTSALPLDAPWRGDAADPLRATVSPDGVLALVEGPSGPGKHATLRMFSLPDATELGARQVSSWDGCAPSWLDGDPVVPVAERGYHFSLEAGAQQVGADGTRRLVAVHHQMQSSCLRVAADALAAGPHPALLGTTTALWSWYVRPLGLAAGLVLLILALAVRHWHERGRRVPWRREGA